MWRIFHKLFGWEYVRAHDGKHSKTCRVDMPKDHWPASFNPRPNELCFIYRPMRDAGKMIGSWYVYPLTPGLFQQ